MTWTHKITTNKAQTVPVTLPTSYTNLNYCVTFGANPSVLQWVGQMNSMYIDKTVNGFSLGDGQSTGIVDINIITIGY